MTKTINNDPSNNKKNGKLNKSDKNEDDKDKNNQNIVINIKEKDTNRDLLNLDKCKDENKTNNRKEELRKIIKEELTEAFRMEADFKPGTMVNWNVLAKVVKTTSSGRQKVDYDRMTMTGAVQELVRSGSDVGGVAIVIDPDGNSHEVEISELSHA